MLRCYQPTRNVILHLRDLRVGEIRVMDSKQKCLKITRRMQHKKKQQYLITVEEELREMATYTLYLEFNGALSDNMEGFYKSSYKTRGGQIRLENLNEF